MCEDTLAGVNFDSNYRFIENIQLPLKLLIPSWLLSQLNFNFVFCNILSVH